MVAIPVNQPEKFSLNDDSGHVPDVRDMVASVIGCKWSLHVLSLVRTGVNRPGAIVRTTNGLTTKVLNERLAKLVRFGIVEKRSYPEVPPRVEYHLTDFGRRFLKVVDEVETLQRELSSTTLSIPQHG